jgi:cytidylate kinase
MDIRAPSPSENDGRHCTVLVQGEDVTWQIRTPEIDQNVSVVSANPAVRRALSERQRRIGLRYGEGRAEKPGVVMVGRDIGTVILPSAPLKIYMDASVEERARRRYLEMRQRGKPAKFAQVLEDVRKRDKLDSERALSPLRKAEDAIVVDTSELTPAQVAARILSLAAEKVQTQI